MKKARLFITGMDCTACATAIENAVGKQKGIVSIGVNSVTGRAVVELDETKIQIKDIIKIIKGLGYKASEAAT
jgi:copper chaperone CopZ